jgi:16S rRNA (guanine527-N7)-methyltransferase
MDSYGPAELAAEFAVSRETIKKLERLAALLQHWQKTIKLIGTASLAKLWRRHVLDSAQLAPLVPKDARILVDLGSGGGFPGLVLAIMLAGRPGFRAHLIESDKRKAAFLATAIGELGLSAEVHAVRIEFAPPIRADVITARACAPLPELLGYAARFWGPGTLGLFHKGADVQRELTEARESWTFDAQFAPSRSDPSGTILMVRALERIPGR